ncbi:MAG: hypothetical protein FJW20_03245 [Acidimicrobiia bacterium]|nr:hypothetical protein [Acidimicrobiia bacterium]
MPARTPKSYFSETEAARSLGITVDEFRVLVKSHIVDRDEDMTNVPVTTYHASDLLVLRLLTGRFRTATAQG